MSLAGFQISSIDVNFHLQKNSEICDKNSADKISSKKDRGWKVPSLVPIRVKAACVIFQTAFKCLHTIRAHLFHCGEFIRLSDLIKLTSKVIFLKFLTTINIVQ